MNVGASDGVISDPIYTTWSGYAASRFKYTAGVWHRARQEVWWSMTSTGSTHDTILCFNYKHNKWSVFTGMAAEAIATVETANDIDQLLFGTGSASDGKLYIADSGNSDNAAAIASTYQTGWFALEATMEASGRYVTMFLKRAANYNLTFTPYRNFDTATAIVDANNTSQAQNIALLSGTYPDTYFPDASDQLCTIQLSADGHHFSFRLNASTTAAQWECYGGFVRGHLVRPAGVFI